MLTVENPKTVDWANLSLTDCAYGNALDTAYTLKLFELFEEKIEKEGPIKLFRNMIVPAMKHFARAEWKGIPISREELERQGKKLQARLMDIEDSLYTIIGRTDINFGSNKQLGEVLFLKGDSKNIEEDSSILKLHPPTRTPTGAPQVDEFALNLLVEEIEKELEQRNESLEE